MDDSAREMCDSVRVGGKNPKNGRWNVVKAAINRKRLLRRRLQKTDVWKLTKKKKRMVKWCTHQSKKVLYE